MSERRFSLSPYYDLDTCFQIHYGPGKMLVLKPFQEIEDPSLRIGIVDNNSINPKRLLLLEKDRFPINLHIEETGEDLVFPFAGKSAFLLFEETVDRALVGGIVHKVLNGQYDRRDHLHCASVADIKKAGWRPFWVPLQMSGKLLHCRLVSKKTISLGGDVEDQDAQNLKDVFIKFC